MGRNGCHGNGAQPRAQDAGEQGGGTCTLVNLGNLHARLGQYAEALEISRATGDRRLEAHTLNVLGETLRALGEGDDAVRRHESARAITIEIGDDVECARALRGIGHARHDDLRWRAAREHWSEALVIYTDLGMPEADQVRELLAALDEAESTHVIEGGVR